MSVMTNFRAEDMPGRPQVAAVEPEPETEPEDTTPEPETDEPETTDTETPDEDEVQDDEEPATPEEQEVLTEAAAAPTVRKSRSKK